MRVRIRDAAGNTQRVELPEICDLRRLRERVAAVMQLPGESVRLSLNRREEIAGPPSAMLSSLGICSGDLLYLLGSDSLAGTAMPAASATASSLEVQKCLKGGSAVLARAEQPRKPSAAELARVRREKCAAAASERLLDSAASASGVSAQNMTSTGEVSCADSESHGVIGVVLNKEQVNLGDDKLENVDVPEKVIRVKRSGSDMVDDEETAVEGMNGNGTEGMPDSLLRVLMTELEPLSAASSSNILIAVVHAAMLETGFVLRASEQLSASKQTYGLPDGWTAAKGPLTLSYGLPVAEAVSCTLRFHTLGDFLLVYGTVNGSSALVNGDVNRLTLGVEGYWNSSATPSSVQKICFGLSKNMRKLWVEVKDNLSLLLLTSLCELAGLQSPVNLLSLPTEVKLHVLQKLPPVALAAFACVCSELRFRSSEDDLWRAHYLNEFGSLPSDLPANSSWRAFFISKWQHKQQLERERLERERHEVRSRAFIPPPFAPGPFPFHPTPGIIGGEYDRFPAIGDIGGGFGGPILGPRGLLPGAGFGRPGGSWSQEGDLLSEPPGLRGPPLGAMGEVGDLPGMLAPGQPRRLEGRFGGLPQRFGRPGRFI